MMQKSRARPAFFQIKSAGFVWRAAMRAQAGVDFRHTSAQVGSSPVMPDSISKSFVNVNVKAKRGQYRRTASEADEVHG
jgi:hypothetical protein